MLNRRSFFKVGGVLALSTAVGRVGWTMTKTRTSGPGQFFVMIRADGGADVTLGLDPWTDAIRPDEKDMFIEYRSDEVIKISDEIFLGPAGAPLKAHAGSFSVINGMFLSQVDNGHPASLEYVSTGTTNAGAAALPVELAIATHVGGFGVLSNTAVSTGKRNVVTSSTDDLKDLSSKADVSYLLEKLFDFSGNGSDYLRSVQGILGSRAEMATFINNLASFGAVELLTPAQIMAAAFISDAANYAQFDLRHGLDTHSGHVKVHMEQQTLVWQDVADIFEVFKKTPYGDNGGTLFDVTTFIVVSEFSRTPALNSGAGKEHNPMTNSVLVAGRGVVKDRTIGASRLVTRAMSPGGEPYHIAYPIDYSTGKVVRQRTSAAKMIFPENVAQTLAEIMGADPNRFLSIPAGTVPLKDLII
jgi:uncharacterized protein (DUF1501 family)